VYTNKHLAKTNKQQNKKSVSLILLLNMYMYMYMYISINFLQYQVYFESILITNKCCINYKQKVFSYILSAF